MGKDPYQAARENMIHWQLIRRGVVDRRLLDVMENIPRHLFVPLNYRENAYEDRPLPIGDGQTISQPYIVGLMTSLLDLKGSDTVLEIGTGSGYQAAILARMAKLVHSVERNLSPGAAGAGHIAPDWHRQCHHSPRRRLPWLAGRCSLPGDHCHRCRPGCAGTPAGSAC